MKSQCDYEDAINNLAFIENKIHITGIDTFDKSLILSVLFDCSPVKTMDDLTKIRFEKFKEAKNGN